MALLLPLLFAALAVAFAHWPSPRGAREALLRAALAFGAIVVVATEGLSLAGALATANVAALWAVLAALGWGAALLARSRGAGRGGLEARLPRSPFSRATAGACGVILGTTLLVAVVAPPHYPDAMTYHLGRVVNWIQAGSVGFHPTGDPRQNYQPPFAEFVILHLQLLQDGDRLANLVQWTAFALSGMTVSLILAELGRGSRVQWTGALVALATPMAILQASGAQNDLVVSLWLLAFLLFLWRLLARPGPGHALGCGIALGLALATKGTAWLYAPAMGAALAVGWALRAPVGARLPPPGLLATAALLAAALNLGPWLRTQAAHGAPVCCGDEYFVARVSPGDAASGVLRNLAVHLGLPSEDARRLVHRAVDALAPTDLDDPATTWPLESFRVRFSLHEGLAGNGLPLALAVAAAAAIAADRRLRAGPAVAWMAAAVLGFFAYAVVLRWQPWASRLQTPTFLVAAVPVALALGSRGPVVRGAVAILLFAGALPFLLLNQSRPLAPRHGPSILDRDRVDQYFVDRRHYREPYRRAAAWLHGRDVAEIGLRFDRDDYEYPFWVLVKRDPAGPPLLRHVDVAHPPAAAARPTLPPPPLVVSSVPGERQRIDGFDYVRVVDFGELVILRRADSSGRDATGARGAPQ